MKLPPSAGANGAPDSELSLNPFRNRRAKSGTGSRDAVNVDYIPLNTYDDLRWLARHWATRIGVKPVQIHIRSMRSKWASMSTAGRLTLNTDLLALPGPLAEYIVVHELIHLLAPNHGKVFKSFLTAYLPDWRERDRSLREIRLGGPGG